MTMLRWLCIYAMFASASGPKVLEYRVVETEAECNAIGERAVAGARAYFSNPDNEYAVTGEIWATFRCVDIDTLKEGQP
jgi:hypothetical protein